VPQQPAAGWPAARWIVRRCIVAGRVQGVYYRASARRRAEELGVTGHALNLPDGRVEVLACGEPAAVASFCEWLWVGSVAARVSAVDCEALDAGAAGRWPTAFTTG
jgi:acylphosphatase